MNAVFVGCLPGVVTWLFTESACRFRDCKVQALTQKFNKTMHELHNAVLSCIEIGHLSLVVADGATKEHAKKQVFINIFRKIKRKRAISRCCRTKPFTIKGYVSCLGATERYIS